MQTLQRFNVLIGLLLAVAIIAIANFGFHVPEGISRLLVFIVAALVFCWCAFAWKPKL
jgi:heme A synthase